MTSTHRTTIFAVIIATALFAAVVSSLLFLSSASDDADRTAADTAATRDLVHRIKLLQPMDMTANANSDLASRLPALLDDAIKTAEIEAEKLERISPQPVRQIGPEGISEVPLQAVFRQITLRQLLLFVTSLSTSKGICISDLHLFHTAGVAPQGPTDAWNAEITISYLSTSPPVTGTTSASAN